MKGLLAEEMRGKKSEKNTNLVDKTTFDRLANRVKSYRMRSCKFKKNKIAVEEIIKRN